MTKEALIDAPARAGARMSPTGFETGSQGNED